jgi:UrcA family protein
MKTITRFPRPRNLIATAVFSALATGFSAVEAADGAHAPTAIVRYGDLDVSSVQGATLLYARIRSAAMHVCSSFDRPLDLNSQALKADCIRQGIANGVAAVNEPALLMVYKANGGAPLPRTVCHRSISRPSEWKSAQASEFNPGGPGCVHQSGP